MVEKLYPFQETKLITKIAMIESSLKGIKNK